MKLSDFAAILEQANLPVTYRAFKTRNAPDYLIWSIMNQFQPSMQLTTRLIIRLRA